jgi:hypothetical protein
MGTGASATAAATLPWPPDFKALLYPGAELPSGLKVTGPTPCTSAGISYWNLGGPSKGRLRVVEDDSAILKIGSSFTVGLCCRAGMGDASGYDSLLLGDDNKHWLALNGEKHTLCCVEGDSSHATDVGLIVGREDWIQIFLRPSKTGGTAVLSVDSEGLVELGTFPTSLVGSKLRSCGWAANEVQIAAIAVWDRCLSWSELSAAIAPRPAGSAAPLPAPVRPATTFQGRVTDLKGKAVADVQLYCSREGMDVLMCGCKSDEDGCFSGSFDEEDAETTVAEDGASVCSTGSTCSWLSFECDGFAPMRSPANTGGHTVLDIKIRPISTSATVDPAEGGSIVDPDSGSSVTVPPNALVYPDGSIVTGPVTVSLSIIDVTDPAGLASMPGDFSAIAADGSTVMLQSLGAAWISAQDEAGQKLDVNQESEGVVLDLRTLAKADSVKLETTPEMWSFNESSGKWELEHAAMKLDGEPVPNQARPAVSVSGSRSGGGRVKGRKGKKWREDEEYDPMGLETACMSPEEFMKQVARDGPKSLSAPIKKLGYINCDLAYHHPQRAVLLQGRVLDSMGQPMHSMQLWGVGRDYSGRTPDTTGTDGRFSAMVAQFDSELDVEVRYGKPVASNDKVEVYFEDPGSVRKLGGDLRNLLPHVTGQYIQSVDASFNEQLGWVKKSSNGKKVQISWSNSRKRWENTVDGKVVFCKSGGDEVELPFGDGWICVLQECPIVPKYAHAMDIHLQTFGPFKTGPPGELVNIGDLATDA